VEWLEAYLDQVPVVIDANGVMVGHRVSTRLVSNQSLEGTIVSFGFANGLSFEAHVTRSGLKSLGSVDLWFESTDCSGPAFMYPSSLLGAAFVPEDPGNASLAVHVPSPDAQIQTTTMRSFLWPDFRCYSHNSPHAVVPAIPVFVWQTEFTPPFRLTTLGETLDSP
jgi:hypothetical protein